MKAPQPELPSPAYRRLVEASSLFSNVANAYRHNTENTSEWYQKNKYHRIIESWKVRYSGPWSILVLLLHPHDIVTFWDVPYPNLQFVALRSRNLSGSPTRQSLVGYWPGQLFSFFMGTDQQGNSVNRPVACGVQKPSLGIDQFHGMDVCISAICQSRFKDVWLRRYCTKILLTSHGYEQRRVEHATRNDC